MILDDMEKVVEANRSALLTQDWTALNQSLQALDEIVDKISHVQFKLEHKEQIESLKQKTLENNQLAKRMQSKMSEAISQGEEAAVYDKAAEVKKVRSMTVHVTG